MQMKYAAFKQEVDFYNLKKLGTFSIQKGGLEMSKTPTTRGECYHGSAEMFCEMGLLHTFCEDYPVVWS